jgi:hypothetical protein
MFFEELSVASVRGWMFNSNIVSMELVKNLLLPSIRLILKPLYAVFTKRLCPAWARALALMILGASCLLADTPAIVPTPREVKWSAEPPASLAPGAVAIVIGKQAADPEKEAARLLKEYVTKRFGQTWPVIREGEEQAAHKTLVILGQRTTCQRLDELCQRHGIELSEKSPGHDGYIIQSVKDGDRLVVLVGGSNARAVEYGQDTFSQMLRTSGGSLAFVQGTVRDAPVIPWRGRPQTSVGAYLRPGELDLYVLSRVNFIDLRSGIYAFQPGETLDKAEIAEAVKQAHKRGIIVFATVNCGVPRKDYDKVMKTFKELLELGADGLWLSFDDKGPGEDPVTLTRQVIELGRQHNMKDHLFATTPPKGSYQKIVTDFNRKIMAVPGMEKALWFWTPVPSPEGLADARSIGLKAKASWWHNWPRLATTQSYVGVPPMSLGWSSPDYGLLAAGGDCLEAVMPWGGNSFGQHYIVPVINWWGWNPQGHDWPALRQRIYGIVFGQDQITAAMKFDDDLQKLFGLFRYSYKSTDDTPLCPARLRTPGEPQAANALVAELTSLLDSIASGAPKQSLLSEANLKSHYLDRMRQEVEAHRVAAGLAFPEDWWPAYQRKILEALYAGDNARVDELASAVRERVLREVDHISESLPPSYPHIASYVAWWRKRASLDAKGWQELTVERRKLLDERLENFNRTILSDTIMMDGLRTPPLEWGIGRWQVANRLLATVVPSPNEQFWGGWIASTHKRNGIEGVVFTSDRILRPGDVGEYAELQAVVPVSGARDRLGVLLFVSSTNKDLFSNTMVKYRWAGYRFIQLLWGDKVLWEGDLGYISDRGDWFMVRLPKIPDDVKTLTLRVRAEDRKLGMNNYTLSYVGPLRLMQLPE